ncbi:nucleoside triphosphatase NudI [Klebsiella pneumoniae subsp. pneumoniae]|nr:nucleoside triphosphatase NudI [Klebsiella pneumoniae subsp. pneumoniae]
MAADRGVFPGQWALSGGVEPGNVLKRRCGGKYAKSSAKNSSLTHIAPWCFATIPASKPTPTGIRETIYMIYLIFNCVSANRDVTINEEFDDYAWVKAEDLKNYDLNAATRVTLSLKGLL